MCYTAESATQQALKYAKRRGDTEEVERLRKQIETLFSQRDKFFHVSGFSHPHLLVFTNDKPKEPQLFYWGLIPSWVKDKKSALQIANQTLNARIETLFEKPSFKASAKAKRCLIYLDAFYEHHHFNKQTYPFRISRNDNDIMVVAGIWNEWVDKESGEVLPTISIVTTVGNEVMTKIHNNPKAEGPRMPVILLTKADEEAWLQADSIEKMLAFKLPVSNDALHCYSVGKLLGKAAIPNTEEAEKEVNYPELAGLLN